MSEAGKAFSKIAPLSYPNRIHQRTQRPPAYTNYREYKLYLRTEFRGQCVYCQKSDIDQDPSAFHVEHYRPKDKKLFPELETAYTNLFYSCAACNRFKGKYWHEDKDKRILNPCDYVMSQHLHFAKELIRFRTGQGELNVELLRLNNSDGLAYRKRLNELVFLLVQGVICLRGTKESSKVEWIDRTVNKLAQLTVNTEERVRSICKVS